MQDELTSTSVPSRRERGYEPATVAGLFDDLDDARGAIDGLVDAGFDADHMSLVASNAAGEHEADVAGERRVDDRDFDEQVEVGGERRVAAHNTVVAEEPLESSEGAVAGAGIGAAVGGVGGVLVGLGLLAVPGIGPALAAGPLVAGLVGAGVGGAAGSIVGALASSGMPEERAGAYAEGVRRGGTLLVVETSAPAVPRAEEVMRRHGSVDIDARVERWRADGWRGFDESAAPFTREEVEEERARNRADRGVRR